LRRNVRASRRRALIFKKAAKRRQIRQRRPVSSTVKPNTEEASRNRGKDEVEDIDLTGVEDIDIDLSSLGLSSSSVNLPPYNYPASPVPIVLEEQFHADGTSYSPPLFLHRLPTDPNDEPLFKTDRLYERLLEDCQGLHARLRVPVNITAVILDYFQYQELHYLFDLNWGEESLYSLDEVFVLGDTVFHILVDNNRWTFHLNTRGLEPVTVSSTHF
jgi:hypothetical protein